MSGGSVTAEFLVDDDTPWEGLLYELAPTSRAGGSRFLQPSRHRAGHNPRARLEGLLAGTYALTVSCFGVAEPLITIGDLQVGPIGACADERLRAVDLRGLVRSLSLRLVDAGGNPITESWVVREGCREGDLGRSADSCGTCRDAGLLACARLGAAAVDRAPACPMSPTVRSVMDLPQ